jgi:glycosyltransferase involved in cell wall biosynthesis
VPILAARSRQSRMPADKRYADIGRPTFSIMQDSLWALAILAEEGFVYDSSCPPRFPVTTTALAASSWTTSTRMARGLPPGNRRFRDRRPGPCAVPCRNRGKGAALRMAFAAATGDIVISMDNDVQKIELLQVGEVPIQEQFLPQLLEKHRGRTLSFSTDLRQVVRASTAIFIAVGAPSTYEGDAASPTLSPSLGR